jgi:hypothetical protein
VISADGGFKGDCERVEGKPQPVLGWFVGGDFVVAAAHLLHEGVSRGQGLR